jgi:hypothetical protein
LSDPHPITGHHWFGEQATPTKLHSEQFLNRFTGEF